MIPDFLKPVKLVYGKGSPNSGGCWMTVLQAYLDGAWTDQCECVDPVIRMLCIGINDYYGSGHQPKRTRDIMNFGLLRVLDTAGTKEDTMRRVWHIAKTALQVWYPRCLDMSGQTEDAARRIQFVQHPLANLDDVAAVIRLLDGMHPWAYHRNTMSNLLGELQLLESGGVDDAEAAESVTRLASRACATATPQALPVGYRPEHLRAHVFPVLDELIALGPHNDGKVAAPACGIEQFHKLVGAET